MALYQPSRLEVSLNAINEAAELAASLVCRSVFKRDVEGLVKLPDISFEGAQKRAELGRKILTLVDGVDEAKLPHEYQLTSRLLRYFAESWSRDADHYWIAVDLTSTVFYGPFAQTGYTGGAEP